MPTAMKFKDTLWKYCLFCFGERREREGGREARERETGREERKRERERQGEKRERETV